MTLVDLDVTLIRQEVVIGGHKVVMWLFVIHLILWFCNNNNILRYGGYFYEDYSFKLNDSIITGFCYSLAVMMNKNHSKKFTENQEL